MKYVMSDIHGEYNTFLKMLKKINFNKDDMLYIIGDVIDRGENSLLIVEYIRNNKNIVYIKGNHEEFFLDFIKRNDPYPWITYGGLNTYNEIAKKGIKYAKDLYNYINQLPYFFVVDKFILVHAGVKIPINHSNLSIEEIFENYGETNCLLNSLLGKELQYKDYITICGHTPTQFIKTNKHKGKIYNTSGTIYIDCGCGYEEGHLGCLCLDNLKEYYVEYD